MFLRRKVLKRKNLNEPESSRNRFDFTTVCVDRRRRGNLINKAPIVNTEKFLKNVSTFIEFLAFKCERTKY